MPQRASKKPVSSKADQQKSLAHLADTVVDNLAHAKRHVSQLSRSTTQGSRDHNRDHANKHLGVAIEHTQKIVQHLKEHPAVAAELKQMDKVKRTVRGSAR